MKLGHLYLPGLSSLPLHSSQSYFSGTRKVKRAQCHPGKVKSTILCTRPTTSCHSCCSYATKSSTGQAGVLDMSRKPGFFSPTAFGTPALLPLPLPISPSSSFFPFEKICEDGKSGLVQAQNNNMLCCTTGFGGGEKGLFRLFSFVWCFVSNMSAYYGMSSCKGSYMLLLQPGTPFHLLARKKAHISQEGITSYHGTMNCKSFQFQKVNKGVCQKPMRQVRHKVCSFPSFQNLLQNLPLTHQ